MPGTASRLRDKHRREAELLLTRAVEEEVHRSGGRTDGVVLLGRARAALDDMAERAGEEYGAYVHALDEAAAGRRSLAERFSAQSVGPAVTATLAAAGVALLVSAEEGLGSAAAFWTGVATGLAGLTAGLAQIGLAHWLSGNTRSGAARQPGGPEQLRLQWLTALELRGVRPFFDQQRMISAATRTSSRPEPAADRPRPVTAAGGGTDREPQLRRDRSQEARQRATLEQSYRQLPEASRVYVGRKAQLTQIAGWVHQGRANPETKPTVVVLHGPPGAGRTTLAVRAAHQLREQFRAAVVVDLRGESLGEDPLPTRDALLHLLNRLGAPRDQLMFRERPAHDAQLRRLVELYHQHLTSLPVSIVLDDAVDAEQVRLLVPERSESLVLVTSRQRLELPDDLDAWVHHMPVEGLEATAAEELLSALAQRAEGAERSADPYDAQSTDRIGMLCGGLPLALRIAGSALDDRSMAGLAEALEAYGPVEPLDRALWLRYGDLAEPTRTLLRRLSLVGRASLGAAASAALLDVGEEEAGRRLTALAGAGLVEHVRGSRFRVHDMVRRFAYARLLDEEDPEVRGAAHERLIRSYAELADSVIRLVDGRTSTRADRFGSHGFTSLDSALRWLDDEQSFITAALRHAEGVDQAAVLHLLGALADYCLLRGDLYRLGELNELTKAADQGLLMRSVQWRTGVAARQLGELDKARSTLSSVVDLYREAQHSAGAARALRDLGITLQQQGSLREAEAKLREALQMQQGEHMRGDRAWTLHALAAVLRDRAQLGDALALLDQALTLHRESESVHGQAWAHFQLGQVRLRIGDVPGAEEQLEEALEQYARTRDGRGEAWAMTQLARARLVAADPATAVTQLKAALARHRENDDARGEAWTLYYLGQAQEGAGKRESAVRALERSRSMFSRMRDVYGLACARHHSARVTRDLRAEQTGTLRNSGFARQLLQDARQDFRRVGVAHGEGWSCIELAVIDAGNGRAGQALELIDTAIDLFAGIVDRRGATWARFLRCTLLPFASPGGSVVGAAVAQQELSELLDELRTATAERRGVVDPALEDCAEAFQLVLERGVEPETGWQAWRLGMVPSRHAREVMGVPLDGAAPAGDGALAG